MKFFAIKLLCAVKVALDKMTSNEYADKLSKKIIASGIYKIELEEEKSQLYI